MLQASDSGTSRDGLQSVEFRFLKPSQETKSGLRNREVRIGGKVTVCETKQRETTFGRVIGVFEKSRIREIRVDHCLHLLYLCLHLVCGDQRSDESLFVIHVQIYS